MVTLILGAAGAAIGGSIGGAILGVSAATIGGFIGSTIGSVVDSWIISSLAPAQHIESARLDTLRITSSTEGAVIPRLHGRMRMGGNIIWATDFREETKTTTQGGGKGGGGGKVKTTEYLYYASFAVALCEGPITGIGRIWADGKPMDLSGVTWRWYPGDEAQTADPFITARMGAAGTPAYRGTAYVVFEELALSTYGNRLPQLTEDQPAHRPFVAAHAVPWPGEMAVFRSPSTDGFELLTTFGSRARIGALVSDFFAGPTSRFDLGNALVVDLLTGTLESVTDLTLFGGANALAIESAPGTWEIVQAGAAELLAPGRYQSDPAPARPARHRGCDGQPRTCRRAGRRAGHRAGVAADRRGRSRHPVELAHRPGEPSGQRRDLCRADLHARGRRAAAVLRRPCRAAVAHAAHARRSDDPLDAPVPRARGRQLGRARGAARPRSSKPTRSRSSTAPP